MAGGRVARIQWIIEIFHCAMVQDKPVGRGRISSLAHLVRNLHCALSSSCTCSCIFLHMSAMGNTLGLVLLPSFVPPTEQRQLVRWALRDHARNPNETNLDTHYMLPKAGLWNQYLRVRRGECEDVDITPHASLSRATTPGLDAKDPTSATQVESPGPRKLISNEAASPSNYLDLVNTPKLPAPPSQTLRSSPTSALIPKLRWANIGWYYHWGTKQYDFTRGPGEIDGLVRSICRRAVESIPWEKVFEGPNEEQEDNMVWGSGGPDWMYWDETYGEYITLVECILATVV